MTINRISPNQIERECPVCYRIFYTWPCRIKGGEGIYCSHYCVTQRIPVIQRFWEKVKKTRSCWIWIGGINDAGYGRFSTSPKIKNIRAHRYSWEIHNGPIPNGLHVLHKCDNRKCVNPDHLFLGTIHDNNNDMYGKGRHQMGEKQYLHKLSNKIIFEIRSLYATGKFFQKEIANKYGVRQPTISDIIRRKSWKHI